ncbi:MAG TPA: biotin--[acetyl-CoA-carboxylase] ligase [Roseiflexaceae bacterium]|nr:biotin--[acetyl-CoA-carboxylase] ligase [Roseiflexaceae bacterium]
MTPLLFSTPERAERFTQDLGAVLVGRTLEYHAQVGSTNDLVRARAAAGAPEGLVVLAEEQLAGRGRQGRNWSAPPGSSLLLSLLLRPVWLPPEAGFALTMLAGVALCEAVEQVAQPLRAALKWPNDLMLPGPDSALRKSAGVLSEVSIEQERIAWVAVGIGINVAWSPAGLVDGRDLALAATSIEIAANRAVDRAALLRALLLRIDARYAALRRGQREELFDAWRSRLATIGQAVQIRLPHSVLAGHAEGVDPSGALLVRDVAGALHSVTAGDVEA